MIILKKNKVDKLSFVGYVCYRYFARCREDMMDLLSKMEEILSYKRKSLLDMMVENGSMAKDFAHIVFGYEQAVEDLRAAVEAEIEEMADHYGEG